jgi:hypothetical protein
VAGLTAAADEFERAADLAESRNTHKEGKLKASVEEARREVGVLRKALEHLRDDRRPTAAPLFAEPRAEVAVSDDEDAVLPEQPHGVFAVGMRVRDIVLRSLGRVVEIGAADGPNAGSVRVEYDDKRRGHGSAEPLWRTATSGMIVPLAGDEMDGIRVTADPGVECEVDEEEGAGE